jgi:DNA polymerase/3'-5' exonuclease PolX
VKLRDAERIAERLVEEMRPFCERIEIAGSVRRRKAEVKDIEIVAVPLWWQAAVEPKVRTLFEEEGLSHTVNMLHTWAERQELVKWIKPGTSKLEPWPPKPEGKYWRGLVAAAAGSEPVKLDLFLASTQQFGLIYLIRTGSAEFSAAILGYAKHSTPYQTEKSWHEERPELKGKPEGGWLVEKATGSRVDTREERAVFELLGLQYVEPGLRIDGRAIKKK